MKKFLKIFGLVALLILAAFVAVFLNSKLYDREVSAYANEATLEIATDWNEQALLKRASPELFAAATPQQIHDAFVNYRQLDRMTKYNVARSIVYVRVEFRLRHKEVTTVYIATAAFEHGIADIKLSLKKRNGSWHSTGIHVTADRLDTAHRNASNTQAHRQRQRISGITSSAKSRNTLRCDSAGSSRLIPVRPLRSICVS